MQAGIELDYRAVAKHPDHFRADPYLQYRERGGLLSREYHRLLTSSGRRYRMIDADADSVERSFAYVDGMVQTSGVDITGEEKVMYACLRTQRVLGGEIPPQTQEDKDKNGRGPHGFTDRELMAEVLLVTSPVRYAEFIARWPNIFPPVA